MNEKKTNDQSRAAQLDKQRIINGVNQVIPDFRSGRLTKESHKPEHPLPKSKGGF